jgi:hypothetical protein
MTYLEKLVITDAESRFTEIQMRSSVSNAGERRPGGALAFWEPRPLLNPLRLPDVAPIVSADHEKARGETQQRDEGITTGYGSGRSDYPPGGGLVQRLSTRGFGATSDRKQKLTSPSEGSR